MTAPILVTGSSGMIGTGLCEWFLQNKTPFIGIDRIKNPWNKKINAHTQSLDLLTKDGLKKLPKTIDTVVHLASNARVIPTIKNPKLALENIQTTYSILEFAKNRKIKKLIFASSREVYGNTKNLPAYEDNVSLHECENPYSASKIAGEALVHSYASCFNLPFTILRFSNVYGRYDLSDRVIPSFLKTLSAGTDLKIYGSKKVVDFTYMDDVVEGINLAIKNFDKVLKKTVNIASGQGTTLQELAHILMKISNSPTKIKIVKNRKGEVVQFFADIAQAKKLLGYKPKFSLERGLKKTHGWYSKYGNF